MSGTTVKKAIHQALQTPATKPSVTRDEARAIIKAATTEPKGPAKVTKEEATLLARLAGQSTFEGAPKYKVTDAARRELDDFFKAQNLPLGGNREPMRASIEKICAGLDLAKPLAAAPKTTGMHSLVISDNRPSDGSLKEAFIDAAKGEFYLKTVAGGRGPANGTTSWYGPISLKGTAPAGNHDADVAAFQAKLATATKDLLLMSESDYPWDYVFKPGAAKTRPTAQDMIKLFGLPADSAVEMRDFAEYFDARSTVEDWMDDSEKAICARYANLKQTLASGLTDIQVFKLGSIEVGVYVVGRNVYGDLVGLHSTAIET